MILAFLFLVNLHHYRGNEIELFDNILSEDVKEHFDDYPLIAKESRSSEWCEVGIKKHFKKKDRTHTFLRVFKNSKKLGK